MGWKKPAKHLRAKDYWVIIIITDYLLTLSDSNKTAKAHGRRPVLIASQAISNFQSPPTGCLAHVGIG